MDVNPLTVELRQFVLEYAEHDIDCQGIDTNVWEEQKQVCICGLAEKLEELLERLDVKLT